MMVWTSPKRGLNSYAHSFIHEFAETFIHLRLFRNAQVQVELCEIPFAGAPEILP